MKPQGIERRIFIVGVPRSGTTLLQSLLAAHSQITSFTESHFFSRHFSFLPRLAEPVLTRNPAPRVIAFLNENSAPAGDAAQWFAHHDGWRLRSKTLLPFQTRSVARRLLAVLDELALSRDSPTWVEKTPRHLRYIPFLERVSSDVPAVRFIHLVREGLPVVASLHAASQSWERPYDIETCIERWNRDVAFSLSRVTAPHDHFALYEELTNRTEPTLRRLFAELELPWEPGILDHYGRIAAAVVTDSEPWKGDVGRPIRPATTGDLLLTWDERERARASLRSDLYRQIAAVVAQRSGTVGGPA